MTKGGTKPKPKSFKDTISKKLAAVKAAVGAGKVNIAFVDGNKPKGVGAKNTSMTKRG